MQRINLTLSPILARKLAKLAAEQKISICKVAKKMISEVITPRKTAFGG